MLIGRWTAKYSPLYRLHVGTRDALSGLSVVVVMQTNGDIQDFMVGRSARRSNEIFELYGATQEPPSYARDWLMRSFEYWVSKVPDLTSDLGRR